MNSTFKTGFAKIGFTVLVAVCLLVGPAGVCAACVKPPAAPSHPCSPQDPSPRHEDCAQPDWVFVPDGTGMDPVPPAPAAVDVLAVRFTRIGGTIPSPSTLPDRERFSTFSPLLL